MLAAGEMNGKSGNINNVCAQMYPQGTKVPGTELLCIFDADQVASKEFFLKTVPLFDGGEPAAAQAPVFYQAAPASLSAIAAPSQTPCSPLHSHSAMLSTLQVAPASRLYHMPGDEREQGGDLS